MAGRNLRSSKANSSLDDEFVDANIINPPMAIGDNRHDNNNQLVNLLENQPGQGELRNLEQQLADAQRLENLQEQMEHQAATVSALARTVNKIGQRTERFEETMSGRFDDIMRAINGRQPIAPAPNQAAAAENNRDGLRVNQQDRDERPTEQRPPIGLLNQEAVAKTIMQGIEKYDGSNYEIWSRKVMQIIEMQRLSEHIRSDVTAQRPGCEQTIATDRSLFAVIESLITDRYRDRLELTEETCYSLWARLAQTNGYQLQLRKESDWIAFIGTTRVGLSLPINEYCDRAIEFYANLKRRGATFDELFLYSFVSGLPDAKFYRSQVKESGASFIEQVENIRQKHSQQGNALATSVCTTESYSSGRPERGGRPPKSRPDSIPSRIQLNGSEGGESGEREIVGPCYNCGKNGHLAKDCRRKKRVHVQNVNQDQQPSSSTSEDEQSEAHQFSCLVAGPDSSASESSEYDAEESSDSDCSETLSDDEDRPELSVFLINQLTKKVNARKDRWILDTGSSVQVCNSLKWFVSYVPVAREFGCSDQGSSLKAEAKGTVRFTLMCGREIEVHDVYYCPTAVMNLLTNVGLNGSLDFTVNSRGVTAVHRYRGRAHSFPFATVEKGQNRIHIDYALAPGEVLTTTRTRSRLPDGEQHQQRTRGRPSTRATRPDADEQPAAELNYTPAGGELVRRAREGPPGANAQAPAGLDYTPAGGELVRRMRGRPRKQQPPRSGVDPPRPSETEVVPPGELDCGRVVREFLGQSEPECEVASEPPERSKLMKKVPRAVRELMPIIAKRNSIKNSDDVHRHHGHIGETATYNMCKLYQVPSSPLNCRLCRVQNIDHHVKPLQRLRTVRKPLELLYLDLVQPYKRNIESYDGTTQTLVILDDKTGFVKTCNLKSKDQTYEKFVEFMRKAERLHNTRMVEIRSDGGTEFLGDFVELRKETGLRHTFSAPYVHENAARIERVNRTLEDRCEKLMQDSGLPIKYYPLAMKRAEQLYNRTIDANGRMPYYEWYGNVDDHLSFVFGEEVAFLYYANHNTPVRGSGRIVSQDSRYKTYGVLLESGEIVNKIYFVKRMPPRAEPEAPELVGSVFNDQESDPDREFSEPSILDVCVMQVVHRKRESLNGEVPVPRRFNDIKKFGERWRRYWCNRVRSELETMVELGVFTPVRREDVGSRPIGTQYVFTRKDGEGKARMVARGDRQSPDSYDETFSPTMSVDSLRLLLKYALEKGLSVHTIDIKRAYLNAVLEEEVYIEIPDGYELIDPDLSRDLYVLQLNRALYGLKQAGLAWYRNISARLRSLGFVQLPRCPTVFVHRHTPDLIVGLYVDDCVLLAESDDQIQRLKDQLGETYTLHDGGPITHILGIDVTRTADSFGLSLRSMIEELCDKHGIVPNPKIKTPLPADTVIKAFEDSPSVEYELYASLVGSLLYIARMARPDILAAVVQLCQFQSAPKRPLYRRLLGILHYLAATASIVFYIQRTGRLDLEAHSDSSLANTHDSCSLFGAVFLIGGSPIAFYSRKNRTVTPSINESEIVAAFEAFKDLIYYSRVLCSLAHGAGAECSPCGRCPLPVLSVDNTGVISFARKGLSKRTRYVEIDYLVLKQRWERAEFDLRYVETESNRADGFTKNLSSGGLATFREQLCLF